MTAADLVAASIGDAIFGAFAVAVSATFVFGAIVVAIAIGFSPFIGFATGTMAIGLFLAAATEEEDDADEENDADDEVEEDVEVEEDAAAQGHLPWRSIASR